MLLLHPPASRVVTQQAEALASFPGKIQTNGYGQTLCGQGSCVGHLGWKTQWQDLWHQKPRLAMGTSGA